MDITLDNEKNKIQSRIIRDMSEGVFALSVSGIVSYVNPSALSILEKEEADMVGKRFAECFLDYSENDDFVQSVLESIYDKKNRHDDLVSYYTGKQTKTLHVVTSFLQNEESGSYVIVVIGDMSELFNVKEVFGKFLSEDIVKDLLKKPGGVELGGKVTDLTIMFSDVRGYTTMSEHMAPDDLITMLNHYLAVMTDIIQSHGGTIIEFIGDGIMAIFGAPVKTSDREDAENAVAAAIAMQSAMTEVNAWNEGEGYPYLQMGIGIHSGRAIVGNIGSQKRIKYGVIGSDVNICGRIESYTVGGQVLISPTTKALVAAELTVIREMTVYPKGLDKELTLYHVTGIGEPYNESVSESEIAPKPLKKAVPVCFHIINGKHGEKKYQYGGIVAVDEGGMILDTAVTLTVFDNLEIYAGGNLFCKVLKETDDGMLLKFTAVPEGFFDYIAESERE